MNNALVHFLALEQQQYSLLLLEARLLLAEQYDFQQPYNFQVLIVKQLEI